MECAHLEKIDKIINIIESIRKIIISRKTEADKNTNNAVNSKLVLINGEGIAVSYKYKKEISDTGLLPKNEVKSYEFKSNAGVCIYRASKRLNSWE
ncbi:MAG: hypothetical protein Q7J35_13880 [Candidatus Methanoperedens sp.]|nr:hypothetical protein [Candidatus Methanoperedens sp.]